MDIEVKSWLFDIHKAILEIDSFIVDMREDFTSYQNDLKTRRAVERNIEIMGEAMASRDKAASSRWDLMAVNLS